jgi:hypothetical protein
MYKKVKRNSHTNMSIKKQPILTIPLNKSMISEQDFEAMLIWSNTIYNNTVNLDKLRHDISQISAMRFGQQPDIYLSKVYNNIPKEDYLNDDE